MPFEPFSPRQLIEQITSPNVTPTEAEFSQMKTIFGLQDDLNTVVAASKGLSDWKADPKRDDSLAEALECAEAFKCLPWKWWKAHGGIDLPNLQVEIIDCLHFQISDLIRQTPEAHLTLPDFGWGKNVSKDDVRVRFFLTLFLHGFNAAPKSEFLIPILKAWAGTAFSGQGWPNSRPYLLGLTCKLLDLDLQKLHDIYVSKNVLNLFRNRNGYLTGEYIKDWNGKEDNEAMLEIVQETGIDAERIYQGLTKRYAEIRAAWNAGDFVPKNESKE